MLAEPPIKRAIVFVDGQNLYYAAKLAFGYTFPNYDIALLAAKVCQQRKWQLVEARFYTGIPSSVDDTTWNHFWIKYGEHFGAEL